MKEITAMLSALRSLPDLGHVLEGILRTHNIHYVKLLNMAYIKVIALAL
jgi:hypothetical protein